MQCQGAPDNIVAATAVADVIATADADITVATSALDIYVTVTASTTTVAIFPMARHAGDLPQTCGAAVTQAHSYI